MQISGPIRYEPRYSVQTRMYMHRITIRRYVARAMLVVFVSLCAGRGNEMQIIVCITALPTVSTFRACRGNPVGCAIHSVASAPATVKIRRRKDLLMRVRPWKFRFWVDLGWPWPSLHIKPDALVLPPRAEPSHFAPHTLCWTPRTITGYRRGEPRCARVNVSNVLTSPRLGQRVFAVSG